MDYLISKKIIIVLFILICLFSGVKAQEVLDGIAATVSDRIILISEVESQLQLSAMQSDIRLADLEPTEKDSMRHDILNQMIEDKLVLLEAEKDTNIQVESQEIEEALSQHLKRIKNQFPSEEAFLAQLSNEGLTLRELRLRYKDEVKNQLYKERFLNGRLTKVVISSGEVKEFYETYKDSLPQRPAGVHLAHILIGTNPSQATKDSLYAYAKLVLAKVKAGEDFALLAKNFSDDVTGQNGGDLGWFSKGDMVEKFEETAYNLVVGETSDIIETPYGYHIIKSTGRDGDRIKASHILFRFIPTEEDLAQCKEEADSVYAILQAGAPFDSIAAVYSDDQTSAGIGGDLGWYAAEELSEEFVDAVSQLSEQEISEPVISQYGYHILKVLEKKEARTLDFNDDYSDIEAIAKHYKAQDELDEWLKQIKENYYIEIKI